MSAIGKRITEARQRRGWSQETLAERAGVTQGAVTNWERGIRLPRGRQMLALAEALGVSPAWIMEPLYGHPELAGASLPDQVADLRRRLDEALDALLREQGDAHE